MTDRLDSSPVLKEVLGDSLEKLQMFHDMLEKEGEIRGLISPNDIDIIWERHILNSAAVVPFILKSAERKKSETEQNNENVSRETSNKKLRIADIGSGGGFPGIIIAAMIPEAEVYLVEPMERRTEWLKEVSEKLGLNNVKVCRCRAEDALSFLPEDKNISANHDLNSSANSDISNNVNRSGKNRKKSKDVKNKKSQSRPATAFDIVTCRAVAPMTKLSGWTLPLLKKGGQLIALKGKSAENEIAKAEKEIKKYGGTDPKAHIAPAGPDLEDTHVVIVTKK